MAPDKYKSKLQYRRTLKGITQLELSELSGVSLSLIQKYERGSKGSRDIDGADIGRLCDLAIALDCTVFDIMESDELINKLKKTT